MNYEEQNKTLQAELAAFKKNNEELIQRHNAAIASWDEERERALREADRVKEWREKYEDLKRLIADPNAMHSHYLRQGNGWEVWSTERIRNMDRDNARLESENAALRLAAAELCAIGRVWVTVWGDKLSEDSMRQFVELEKQILQQTTV